MSHQQQSKTEPASHVKHAPSSEFLTHCYRNALDRLNSSFVKRRPIAIMIGEGKSASSFVIGRFLSDLDEEVVSVRINEPCANAGDFLRCIIRAIGIEPNELDVTDLESVLKMFLSFQKSHDRRTIVCIEDVQDSEWWVLDKIRYLVEMEAKGNFGFMLIVSGQLGLKELLHTRPLSSVCQHAGQRISLSPFTLIETTEYMRRRVEGATTATIDQVFDYHAISLVHDLCAGVPDAISKLVSGCLDLADDAGLDTVTIELVKKAYEIQREGTSPQVANTDAATANLNGLIPRPGRLIVQISGEYLQENALRQGHILIGRSKLCDIHIDSPAVSRHHALINYSAEGAILVDLGSKNGTYVDGYRINQHSLMAGETVAVGDCRIEYVIDDERQAGTNEVPSVSYSHTSV